MYRRWRWVWTVWWIARILKQAFGFLWKLWESWLIWTNKTHPDGILLIIILQYYNHTTVRMITSKKNSKSIKKNEKHTCSLSLLLDLQVSLRNFLLCGCEAVELLKATPRARGDRDASIAWIAMLVLARDWDKCQTQNREKSEVFGLVLVHGGLGFLTDMDSLVLLRYEKWAPAGYTSIVYYGCGLLLFLSKWSCILKSLLFENY